VTNVSPGGFWDGIDSKGRVVLAVVTETGRFHLITEDLSQGSGVLSVSNGNNLSGNFTLVTQLGYVFADGTTMADCSLTGTITERQNINATVNCVTTAGLQDQSTATLDYYNLYERDSSLATIAGNYQGVNAVLNVAGNGVIFSQDAVSGCVINGQVSIINSMYDVYDIEFAYSNCAGESAVFNGANFIGLALLDNTVNPEEVIVAATGTVAGVYISFVQSLPRL
jgi:hypothetical protein